MNTFTEQLYMGVINRKLNIRRDISWYLTKHGEISDLDRVIISEMRQRIADCQKAEQFLIQRANTIH